MKIYWHLLVSEAVLIGAFFAVMLIKGGWEAVDMLLAIVAGGVFVSSLIALLVSAERMAPGGRAG